MNAIVEDHLAPGALAILLRERNNRPDLAPGLHLLQRLDVGALDDLALHVFVQAEAAASVAADSAGAPAPPFQSLDTRPSGARDRESDQPCGEGTAKDVVAPTTESHAIHTDGENA
jgi:hypothetical protein